MRAPNGLAKPAGGHVGLQKTDISVPRGTVPAPRRLNKRDLFLTLSRYLAPLFSFAHSSSYLGYVTGGHTPRGVVVIQAPVANVLRDRASLSLFLLVGAARESMVKWSPVVESVPGAR